MTAAIKSGRSPGLQGLGYEANLIQTELTTAITMVLPLPAIRRRMKSAIMAIAAIATKIIHPEAPLVSSAKPPLESVPKTSLNVPTATAAATSAANAKTWVKRIGEKVTKCPSLD